MELLKKNIVLVVVLAVASIASIVLILMVFKKSNAMKLSFAESLALFFSICSCREIK